MMKGVQRKACWEHRAVRLALGMGTNDQIMVGSRKTFVSPLDKSPWHFWYLIIWLACDRFLTDVSLKVSLPTGSKVVISIAAFLMPFQYS